MNKKDVSLVKRNLKHNNAALLVNAIGIYHVDTQKNVSGQLKRYCDECDMVQGKSGNEKYWDLIEEDKFFEIAKKTLTGKLYEALTENHIESEKVSDDLNKVLSNADNQPVVESFVKHIAENLKYTGEYAVMVMICEQTKRSKAGNGYSTTDDDLCDEADIYRYMILSICKMQPVEIGLFHDKEHDNIHHWSGNEHEITVPVCGFLYPCIDNSENVLVYSKGNSSTETGLCHDILTCDTKITTETIKNTVESIVEKVCESKSEAKSVYDDVADKIIGIAKEKETVSESDIKGALEDTLKEAQTDSYNEHTENKINHVCQEELPKDNLSGDLIVAALTKPTAVTVKVTENNQNATISTINGEKCLVIRLDDSVVIKGEENLV